MAEQADKIAMLREMMGDSLDRDMAAAVLEAHGWDVEMALNTMLSGGDIPPVQPAAPAKAYEEPRAAMRTGYTDTLMAPISLSEQRRAEEERLEREREQERQAEERKAAQERARKQEMERRVLDQRKEAERAAFERRKAKQEAEELAWRQGKEKAAAAVAGSLPGAQAPASLGPAATPAAAIPAAAAIAAATLAAVGAPSPAAPETAVQTTPSAVAAGAAAAPAPAPASAPAAPDAAMPQKVAEAPAYPADVPAAAGAAAAEGFTSKPKEVDAVAQALMALRKKYRDSDRAGLVKCVQTLKVYITNLANAPHEPKFQRINCENAAFQQRVGAFEGAIAVLEACGFAPEDGVLVVGQDFLKARGSKLFDALSKMNVLLNQLE